MASEDAAEGKRGIHLPSGKGSAAAHMGKSWFFGIGINEYAHFPRLHNAVKDVQDVLALLQSQYDLDDEAIILLFDQEATRQKIIQGFRRLVHEVKPADKLIIYYSGHGHFDKESNLAFWIPQDANPGDDSGYIPNSTVRDYIRAIGSLHTFLISDSCFSGTFFVRGVSRSGTAQEELERIPSRWGLVSGRHNEEVADGAPGENSPFAASILKVLERNRAPRLNVARLADQVVEMTRSNYTQLPEGNPLQGVGHEGGQYIFQLVGSEPVLWQRCTQEGSIAALNAYLDAFPDGPHAAEALERIALIEEDQHWKEAQRRDTISAYRTFLGKFPKGAQAETARKRIRELQGKEEKPLETARPTPTPVPQEPAAEVKPTPTTAPMEAPAGGPRRKWYLPVGILAAIAVAVVLWALFGRKGEPEYAEVPETTARETDDRRPGPEEPGIPVPELVFVPGGAFLMGCTEEQGPDCADDERPPREMEVGDFLIGRFELTFAEYDAFCRDTNRPFPDDEGWGRDRLPAIHISCLDAIDYCNWLSEMEGLRPVYFREGEQVRTDPDANGYRLPTEAEWEFAARARHNEFKYAGTSREEDLPAFANFAGEADGFPFTAPVGSLEPNELGLHDMSGNVREWCWNPSRLVLDERLHILRGGAWNDDPPRLRVSSRSFHPLEEHGPGFGFRVCRSDL